MAGRSLVERVFHPKLKITLCCVHAFEKRQVKFKSLSNLVKTRFVIRAIIKTRSFGAHNATKSEPAAQKMICMRIAELKGNLHFLITI